MDILIWMKKIQKSPDLDLLGPGSGGAGVVGSGSRGTRKRNAGWKDVDLISQEVMPIPEAGSESKISLAEQERRAHQRAYGAEEAAGTVAEEWAQAGHEAAQQGYRAGREFAEMFPTDEDIDTVWPSPRPSQAPPGPIKGSVQHEIWSQKYNATRTARDMAAKRGQPT